MTVDYDQIAARYDAHRPSGSDLCFDRLADALAGSRRILEIGAGTGNTTRFVSRAVDAMLVAMEPSAGMAEQARATVESGFDLDANITRLVQAIDRAAKLR